MGLSHFALSVPSYVTAFLSLPHCVSPLSFSFPFPHFFYPLIFNISSEPVLILHPPKKQTAVLFSFIVLQMLLQLVKRLISVITSVVNLDNLGYILI